MGLFASLWLAQFLQVTKNEERDFIARVYDWPLGHCRTRVPIGTQLLTIELEDMYFLTSLLKRGVPISFTGQRVLPEKVDLYLARHCIPGARLVGGRIPIKDIRDLPLRSILFTITSVTGSTSTHLASRSQVAYGVQCFEPTLFNWSAAFLRNVKEQISRCRTGQKQFGYGSFLVSFFLECIPQMQPQIALAV
jgi:hypothetical protein